MLNKKISASLILLFVLLCASGYAEDDEAILRSWTKETTGTDKSHEQSVKIRATYYANEYVEALIASEAEKNLWTNDEMENYKYTLLKNLDLAESIPFHIEFEVQGTPMYAGPFDKHITMQVGKNKYQPSDYDKRFNFRISGQRDGMVYFPRYDPKTGKEILAGAKDVRIILDGAIVTALAARGDILWVWDLTKDRGQIGGGKAANMLEIDRLIKRTDKLADERAALQKQIDALNKEINEVNSRIDELQTQ